MRLKVLEGVWVCFGGHPANLQLVSLVLGREWGIWIPMVVP